MKLVKFDKNWADECDVYGFRVMSDDSWNELRTLIENSTSFEMYFGTNEGWGDGYGDDAASDLLEDLKAVDITVEQAETIIGLFGASYGVFPDAECFS